MVKAPQRIAFGGPALVRLLARLTDVDVPESGQSLSQRLSQWLGWTDAIALSTALAGSLPAVAGVRANADHADGNACERVRASLQKAIAGDSAFTTARRRRPAHASTDDHAADVAAGYSFFRQRYVSIQQRMETDIGSLRGRLRMMLVARKPSMSRLAVVDAVMERALDSREKAVLATVPVLLAAHFERLRRAEAQRLADARVIAPPDEWLDVFRDDMRSVLLAELDVRLQPVEGLLATLRAC